MYGGRLTVKPLGVKNEGTVKCSVTYVVANNLSVRNWLMVTPTTADYKGVSSLDGALEIDLAGFTCDQPFTDVAVQYNLKVFKPVTERFTKPSTKYITESGANIRMRWGWSLNDSSNRWDMVQNGYRPQKDFLHDEYVESRLHVRGRGKAFQIEIRNDDNKDFRLAGMNLLVRSR